MPWDEDYTDLINNLKKKSMAEQLDFDILCHDTWLNDPDKKNADPSMRNFLISNVYTKRQAQNMMLHPEAFTPDDVKRTVEALKYNQLGHKMFAEATESGKEDWRKTAPVSWHRGWESLYQGWIDALEKKK